MQNYLVVGAGFAGAVYARTLAEDGHQVHVIDRRNHVAGNAYDFVDHNGVRVHRYGPHLFHTKNDEVVKWLSAFTDWEPYQHRVKAILPSGMHTPLPVNRRTINDVFGIQLSTSSEVEAFLRSQSEAIAEPRNAADYLYKNIGQTLTNLFFRPYTKKMWNLDLEDMSDSVVRRIPIRTDDEDRYFPDATFQLMPKDGYTRIFERIFSHPNIKVSLGVSFAKEMEASYDHVFNSMAIDEYFDCQFGALPYRSIKFHSMTLADAEVQTDVSVLNFTDDSRYTRETHWHLLPNHLIERTGAVTKTIEEPCGYLENQMERYYPVKTADGRFQELYLKYRDFSNTVTNVTFIGRCGTYQYLDMDQVINQSLIGAKKFKSDAKNPK
ncbi:MAG: NAD(P)-binding protein [Agrobacterium tumefaciens]|nr:NAD(P)-binding protein [Agrobacterium tumefaciens]